MRGEHATNGEGTVLAHACRPLMIGVRSLRRRLAPSGRCLAPSPRISKQSLSDSNETTKTSTDGDAMMYTLATYTVQLAHAHLLRVGRATMLHH